MRKNNSYLAIVSLCLMMLGMSLLGGSRGVIVPVLKQDFTVSDSQIGMMFLCSTLGYMLFTFFAGMIIEKTGKKLLMQIGLVIVIFGLGIMLWSPNFVWFTIGYIVNGAGNAFIIMGVNLVTPLFAFAFSAALLNIVHGSYGLGSAIVQRLTGYMLTHQIGWRTMFMYFMIVNALVLFVVSLSRYPQKQVSLAQQSKSENKEIRKSILSNKVLYFYMFALGIGLVGEHGINNWFVNLMKEGHGLNENTGSFYLSLFFILFTVGRFVGGFVMEKTGHLRGVVMAQAISVVLFMTGLLLGRNGLILMSCAGLFQAVIYPTIVVTVSKNFPKGSAYALALITSVASILNNGTSLLIGVLNDNIGVLKAFYVVPASVLIGGIFAYLIVRSTREQDKLEATGNV